MHEPDDGPPRKYTEAPATPSPPPLHQPPPPILLGTPADSLSLELLEAPSLPDPLMLEELMVLMLGPTHALCEIYYQARFG